MIEKPDSNLQTSFPHDAELLVEFADLWSDAEKIWDQNQNAPAFHSYVSADYAEVFHSLAGLRDTATTVLEWGSGLGVVTIMADRMGFDAFGIEAEDGLVRFAHQLSEKHGSSASFATGSFVPEDYTRDAKNGNQPSRSMIDLASGYGELGMELGDFDVVYAYPWPRERVTYHNIMQKHGRPDAKMLMYDTRKGMSLTRFD